MTKIVFLGVHRFFLEKSYPKSKDMDVCGWVWVDTPLHFAKPHTKCRIPGRMICGFRLESVFIRCAVLCCVVDDFSPFGGSLVTAAEGPYHAASVGERGALYVLTKVRSSYTAFPLNYLFLCNNAAPEL